MTDLEFNNWLLSPSALKCVLVEATALVGGTPTTFYISNRGYTTSPSDTPSNVSYEPIIKGGLDVSSSILDSETGTLSWGDIELDNYDGVRDDWLNYIWKNKTIKVFIGDMAWVRADFKLIFDGVIEDISCRDRQSMNILLRDKMQLLNTTMSDAVLGGTTSNKDRSLPLCFGECHNVTPLLIDPVNLIYQVHNGAIEDLIEVRDDGVPVTVIKYLPEGKFKLTNSPVGTITASVQGAKFSGVYYNTVGNLVQAITMNYGKTPLSLSDIDSASFSTFETFNTQPVGIFLDDKTDVISVISELAKSIGAVVVFNPYGRLQIKKIDLVAVASKEITDSDILYQSLTISDKPSVVAAVNLNYCKNYTVQSSLETGIPAEHIQMFAKEWLEASASDTAVATQYGLPTKVDKIDTLLLDTASAIAEATRRLNLYKTQRYIFSFSTDISTLDINLGDYILITSTRYGLDSSKTGQVVSKTVNWFDNTISYEVLV